MALKALVKDLEQHGPILPHWPLRKAAGRADWYHGHLKRGRPSYVAVWQVPSGTVQVIHILYAGTHEGVNYDRLC